MPWPKGKPQSAEINARRSAALRGRVFSDEHRRLLSANNAMRRPEVAAKAAATRSGRTRPDLSGELHPNWKGDEAGYGTVHDWLRRHHPKAGRCDECGAERRTQYAYLGDQSGGFKRDRSKYRELCSSCHKRFDLRRPGPVHADHHDRGGAMTDTTSGYVQPRDAIAETCAEWRKLGLPDDSAGVVMEVIDRLARQEGLVDAEGYADAARIDLAASEWIAVAERWFDEHAHEGEGVYDHLPPLPGGFIPGHRS